MPEPAKQNATEMYGKQHNKTDTMSVFKPAYGMKYPPNKVKHSVQETTVNSSRSKDEYMVNTSRSKEGYNGGYIGANTAAPFVEVPLNSSQSSTGSSEDDDFEKIGTADFSHGGQSYSAYNGQPDHVRKYPKDFGKKEGGK